MKTCTQWPAALLVLVFVYAAVSKLLDFGEFGAGLYAQPFPPVVAGLLRYLLPAAELAAAALLLFPRTRWYGLQLSLVMLALFTGYVGLVLLHFWSGEPCVCGGLLSDTSWGLHLALNLFLLCLNLTAIVLYLKERRPAS